MYIVAIGWGYVILMMAITAGSVAKALTVLIVLGVLPLALFAYLADRPRRQHRSMVVPEDIADQGNGTDAQSDQH